MTQIINSFFSRGNNSTVQLSRGTNLSYQSTGTANLVLRWGEAQA